MPEERPIKYIDINEINWIWCVDLLGRPASEVAEKQNSSVASWETEVNIDGYDYYYDPSSDERVYYLFPVKEGYAPLVGEDICLGVLTTVEEGLSISSGDPADLLAEISELFSVEFTWTVNEEEESYRYFAKVKTDDWIFYITIYTNPDKTFAPSFGLRLTIHDLDEEYN